MIQYFCFIQFTGAVSRGTVGLWDCGNVGLWDCGTVGLWDCLWKKRKYIRNLKYNHTYISSHTVMAACLEHKGFKYWKHFGRPTKIYYTCAFKRKSNCQCRLSQNLLADRDSKEEFIIKGEHTCTGDQDSIVVWSEPVGDMEASERDIRFKHPCTTLVAGPTGSGKTVLVRKLLQDYANLFDNINTSELKVTWCYGQWQSSYSKAVPNVKISYVDGLIDQHYVEKNRPHLVVIDDLMTELGNNKELANLFTKGSHHLGISVIFIVQNVFHQASQMRTISLNSHYIE
jgi:hypothetical protein